MSKSEIKELAIIILFSILNTIIAFGITNLLGVYNTVVIRSFSVMYGDMTWESIIFMGFSIIESSVYEYIVRNKRTRIKSIE